jgi:hypothetical protein
MSAYLRGAESIISQAWDTALDVERTEDYIRVNGVGAESHEDFFISRTDLTWNFCKTNRKDYDQVVTALLILAKYLFPQDFTVSSDGNWTSWAEGRDLFTQAIYLEPAESSVFGGRDFDHKRGDN